MKRALLLLVVIAGVALAEEQKEEEEARTVGIVETLGILKLVKASLLAPLGAVFELATQIVVLIALILLISTIKKTEAFGDMFSSSGSGSGYEYYHVPAAPSSSGSSYSSGYNKRSVDSIPPASNPFMDLPVVQRLTERVQNAIENFKA